MKDKNSLVTGLMIGALLPIIGYFLLSGIYELMEGMGWVSDSGFRPKFRERTVGIIAIAINAVTLNFYQKKYLNDTVRGIVVMTAVWVVVWLIMFGKYVL